jgi:hypothetical protein|tara:strand:+ start:7299 stop:7487 length:189 start_codon:yes stop_codon:yes gene_type:complete
MKTVRNDIITDDHLEYLDNLRESGATNMYGSPAYVEAEFDCTIDEAKKIVAYWMDTFGDDKR